MAGDGRDGLDGGEAMRGPHQLSVWHRGLLYGLVTIWPDRASLIRCRGWLSDDLTRGEAASLLRMYRERRPAMEVRR
jgi:hypothetical protein